MYIECESALCKASSTVQSSKLLGCITVFGRSRTCPTDCYRLLLSFTFRTLRLSQINRCNRASAQTSSRFSKSSAEVGHLGIAVFVYYEAWSTSVVSACSRDVLNISQVASLKFCFCINSASSVELEPMQNLNV